MTSTFVLSITTFIYVFSFILYISGFIFRKEMISKTGYFFLIAGFFSNTAGFILRWIDSYNLGIGHIPLSNEYESLIFFSMAGALLFSVMGRKFSHPVIGAIVTLIISLAMAYAGLSPRVESAISPLMPALKSNWLTVHVFTCFLGYSGFAISFAASLLILFSGISFFSRFLPEEEILENLNYRMILFGFMFLSLGIITGAVWANSAWGRYWSWDPKETWSLITWIMYAIILHARYMGTFSRKTIAWLSIIGFISVIFTYFGVNLILSGLHSYA